MIQDIEYGQRSCHMTYTTKFQISCGLVTITRHITGIVTYVLSRFGV